jgi:DNA-binding transcriptional LysR family regulator
MDRFSNINTLLAFVTVAREGNVSRAAEILNLTQPAISHQLKRLAEETGVALFRRTTSGVEITPDGAALLPKAEQVLRAMGEFHRVAHKRTGKLSGKLKIGTIVDPEFTRLGKLLHSLCSEYPEIEPELSHGVSGEILARLKRGQLDAGFYLSAPDKVDEDMAEPQIHCQALADFSYRVIGPAGWQDRLNRAEWDDLAQLPWIGTPPSSAHNRLLKGIFSGVVRAPRMVALVDQEPSMLEMVRAGLGLSLCRESIALHQHQSAGLAICPHLAVPARLNFITLERNRAAPRIAALFEVIQAIW